MKGLLAVVFLAVLGTCTAQESDATAIMNKLQEGYDKRLRPNFAGAPLDIGVTMYFIDIFDISTKEESMKSYFYFRQSWKDPRLAFNATPEVQSIVLNLDGSKMFWQPDSFFPDGYSKYSHDGNMFFRIRPDGTILKSVRVLLKSSVNMDLHYFPLDHPTASLSMESYGYTAKDIKFRWDRGSESVGVSKEAGTSEISISHWQLETEMIHLTSGNYSRLKVNIDMARKGGYYLNHFYLPAVISFLLVWGSFWFHPTNTVVRVILVLASFLTGNYLLATSWNFSPAVGYSTMLDKFIVFGLVLSALAAAQCALVVCLERRGRKLANLLEGGEKPAEKKTGDDEETASYLTRSTRYLMTIHQHRRNYLKIDIFFRAIYPVIYIIYNICYWMSFP